MLVQSGTGSANVLEPELCQRQLFSDPVHVLESFLITAHDASHVWLYALAAIELLASGAFFDRILRYIVTNHTLHDFLNVFTKADVLLPYFQFFLPLCHFFLQRLLTNRKP